jgi:hypothetical protein
MCPSGGGVGNLHEMGAVAPGRVRIEEHGLEHAGLAHTPESLLTAFQSPYAARSARQVLGRSRGGFR